MDIKVFYLGAGKEKDFFISPETKAGILSRCETRLGNLKAERIRLQMEQTLENGCLSGREVSGYYMKAGQPRTFVDGIKVPSTGDMDRVVEIEQRLMEIYRETFRIKKFMKELV